MLNTENLWHQNLLMISVDSNGYYKRKIRCKKIYLIIEFDIWACTVCYWTVFLITYTSTFTVSILNGIYFWNVNLYEVVLHFLTRILRNPVKCVNPKIAWILIVFVALFELKLVPKNVNRKVFSLLHQHILLSFRHSSTKHCFIIAYTFFRYTRIYCCIRGICNDISVMQQQWHLDSYAKPF